jgi:hypothetical protein
VEEWNVAVFKAIEFVQMDADVLQRKKYGSDIRQTVVASPVTSTKLGTGDRIIPCELEFRFPRTTSFLSCTNERCREK